MHQRTPHRPTRRRLVGTLVAALAALTLAAPAAAHHLEASVTVPIRTLAGFGAKPDLYPLLPVTSASYGGSVPAVFVDAYELPNRVVYRFDTVIGNAGGTLDLYSTDGGKTLRQVLWPGGRPPAGDRPTPLAEPKDSSLASVLQGGKLVYSDAIGHWHWHYDLAARYELLLPKGKKRVTGKIGFCMFDTYDFQGKETYFRGSGTQSDDWCRPNIPSIAFIRMGISPGVGDYYAAQLADQWIDMTGLAPREYVLRAVVNPGQRLIESDGSNNTLEVSRMIPGATATSIAQSVPRNASTDLSLAGQVIGPEVHAFTGWKTNDAGEKCALRFAECYVTAQPDTLTFQIVEPPKHGTVALSSSNGTTAVATYTPDPGYEGGDSFVYTTTDTRQLTSARATVQLGVGEVPVSIAAPVVNGAPAVGAALKALPGSWIAPEGAALAFTYSWERCTGGKGGACKAIASATRATYRISKADVGNRMRVIVTALNGAATGESRSRRTSAVGRFALILGTQFDDVLLGKKLSEKMEGGRGADVLRGRGGNDVLLGGGGPDRIYGGPGVDKLRGGGGNDRIVSKDGRADIVSCGAGIDTVIADRKDRVARSCENVRFA